MVRFGLYKHYRGNVYKVFMKVQHTETSQKLIVYYNINNPSRFWARPESMFTQAITVKRFEFIKH
jgi:hypothetical protein